MCLVTEYVSYLCVRLREGGTEKEKEEEREGGEW